MVIVDLIVIKTIQKKILCKVCPVFPVVTFGKLQYNIIGRTLVLIQFISLVQTSPVFLMPVHVYVHVRARVEVVYNLSPEEVRGPFITIKTPNIPTTTKIPLVVLQPPLSCPLPPIPNPW